MYASMKKKKKIFVKPSLFLLFLYSKSDQAAGNLFWEQFLSQIKGRAISTHQFYLQQQLYCSCFQGDFFFPNIATGFFLLAAIIVSAGALASHV